MTTIRYAATFILVCLIFFAMLSFQTSNEKNIYQFKMKNIDGKDISLSQYKGKVLVIVNVASECGYTPQYELLQKFYEQYKTKGVEVLGFPANNFMGQEPGTDAEIKTFCTSKYHVTFPMFSKISVKGSEMHPFYKFLTNKSENGTVDEGVSWNFNKYVIDKNGKVVAHFASKIKPTDDGFLKMIDGLLK